MGVAVQVLIKIIIVTGHTVVKAAIFRDLVPYCKIAQGAVNVMAGETTIVDQAVETVNQSIGRVRMTGGALTILFY